MYLLTLQGLEIFFYRMWRAELQEAFVSDVRSLSEGKIRMEDRIEGIVARFLNESRGIKAGMQADIFVTTGTKRLLYPSIASNGTEQSGHNKTAPAPFISPPPEDRARIAENNRKILEDGIQLLLKVDIPRNSWLANGILTFYIMIFAFLPYWAYLLKTKEARLLEISKRKAIESANLKLTEAQEKLAEASARANNEELEIKRLKADLDLAGARVAETENEALSEIDRLDRNLQKSAKIKEELEAEVRRLEAELKKVDTSPVPASKQQKQVAETAKRFKTLYKNLEFSLRSVDGFLELEAHMQLQSEELISTLNEDGSKVPVKRKVFIRKGSLPVFECEFGRKGRLYWSPGPGVKRQVWVIGTKNSQSKDLAHLDKL